MLNVFDIIKLTQIDHKEVDSNQVVVTDGNGKPNAVLTELLNDVVGNMRIFINMDQIYSVDELTEALATHTPLPTDVLDEYEKVLREPIYNINFVPKRGQVELVVGE
ncbi:hypothetical protein [Lactiplantibacillus mudanjiangensis]|uniref:Uncharacterized protein n=1 Tax=Lactiplantibacillus mudanjiangensis TaxID=1296538 RepID=A0A660DZZ8_9LACO|nr:hypothetical protein [Lactiplantibacillus mudanjiangensis]VDG21353.1 hypothetical protein MUDAN_BIHEEGNE_02985 [Lactiplantibacillus mudanjiangensis]VDG23566.1 hypothetical protein MUDAN_IGPPGNFN_02121 [Lactiplantibacillus mudanjiangensis]VDG28799.1 hypothetical protein MUDAN_MDHGFNIF_03196 [Lactiplantibacillus mudanjiangensis]VDG32187.1 hypothetical protein MUDAN_DOGOELCO_01479 [Lactiplantibacillus mudanjiangensis]